VASPASGILHVVIDELFQFHDVADIVPIERAVQILEHLLSERPALLHKASKALTFMSIKKLMEEKEFFVNKSREY
jgi:hypothetical protein